MPSTSSTAHVSEPAWLRGLEGGLPTGLDEQGAWEWPTGRLGYEGPTGGPQVAFDTETELPMGWNEAADTEGVFSELFRLARQVYREGACSLPGSTIKYEPFVQIARYAVHCGFVDEPVAERVLTWLRWGTDAGVQRTRLRGTRVFTNYESACGEYKGRVAKALGQRVDAGKTVEVGVWSEDLRLLAAQVFGDFFVAPMLAVPKPLQPEDCRPATDHGITTLNDATDMEGLSYELTAHEEIRHFLKTGHVMHVSDVDAAFPILALCPWLWPFFFVRFFSASDALHLYAHTFADFGTRGMPGAFKLFFVDVFLGMARAVGVLTLPMAVWVDDTGLIGSSVKRVRAEMTALQRWAKLLGVSFKALKDKPAAHVVLMIGFWWDSFARTITLDSLKLGAYMAMFKEFSIRSSLCLRERRQGAGRAQRALMTAPPGARCILQPIFAAMKGLTFAWQQRKTTASERTAWRFVHDILDLNLGRGYFSYDQFKSGPVVYTDASKSGRYSGGGYVENDGTADYWVYGSSAAKEPIDWAEADTVLEAARRSCYKWYNCIVDFYVDNTAFEQSGEAGRSRVERLNYILISLFLLQISFNFIIRYHYVPSEENVLADHLSRGRIAQFWLAVRQSHGFFTGTVVLASDAGRVLGKNHTARQYGTWTILDASKLAAFRQPHRVMEQYSREVLAAVLIQAFARGFLVRRKLLDDGYETPPPPPPGPDAGNPIFDLNDSDSSEDDVEDEGPDEPMPDLPVIVVCDQCGFMRPCPCEGYGTPPPELAEDEVDDEPPPPEPEPDVPPVEDPPLRAPHGPVGGRACTWARLVMLMQASASLATGEAVAISSDDCLTIEPEPSAIFGWQRSGVTNPFPDMPVGGWIFCLLIGCTIFWLAAWFAAWRRAHAVGEDGYASDDSDIPPLAGPSPPTSDDDADETPRDPRLDAEFYRTALRLRAGGRRGPPVPPTVASAVSLSLAVPSSAPQKVVSKSASSHNTDGRYRRILDDVVKQAIGRRAMDDARDTLMGARRGRTFSLGDLRYLAIKHEVKVPTKEQCAFHDFDVTAVPRELWVVPRDCGRTAATIEAKGKCPGIRCKKCAFSWHLHAMTVGSWLIGQSDAASVAPLSSQELAVDGPGWFSWLPALCLLVLAFGLLLALMSQFAPELLRPGWAARRPLLFGPCQVCGVRTGRRCSLLADEWYCSIEHEAYDRHAHYHRSLGQCGECDCEPVLVVGSRVAGRRTAAGRWVLRNLLFGLCLLAAPDLTSSMDAMELGPSGTHPREHGGFLPMRSSDGQGNLRTDLYFGLPGDLMTWIDELFDNRLSASSMRTVSRAIDLWDEAREPYGWDQVILTDDRQRGAKMVCFVRHMMRDMNMPYSTITNYVWGMRTWMGLQHQADPCAGVIGWTTFMKSVKVPTFVIGEPRRRVPLAVLRSILRQTDLSDFVQVQLALILVVLFLTFSRSEPFPKNHTGEESFDPKSHWLVRDFTVRGFNFGYLFGVRFKTIKQDPRLERASVAGDGYEWGDAGAVGGYDFTYVGDVPGSLFSIFTWFRRFMSFFEGGRSALDYMFLDPDRTRPLTYRVLTTQFHRALERVGYTGPPLGLHGVRVAGYNESKNANGEDLTAIHGLWMGPKASGHGRYHRASMLDVANIPARMLSEEDTYSPAAVARRISRNARPSFQAADERTPARGEAAASVDDAERQAVERAADVAAGGAAAAAVATPAVGQPVVVDLGSSDDEPVMWGSGIYSPPPAGYAFHAQVTSSTRPSPAGPSSGPVSQRTRARGGRGGRGSGGRTPRSERAMSLGGRRGLRSFDLGNRMGSGAWALRMSLTQRRAQRYYSLDAAEC